MNSPYLDQSRPTRKLIEELIAAREAATSWRGALKRHNDSASNVT